MIAAPSFRKVGRSFLSLLFLAFLIDQGSSSSVRAVPWKQEQRRQQEEALPPPFPRRDESLFCPIGNVTQRELQPRRSSFSNETLIDPPISFPNPYGWMRDDNRSENSEAYRYLLEENEYTDRVTAHLTDFEEHLYNEILSYVDETDSSLPREIKDYKYYTRTIQGMSYGIYCRAPRNASRIVSNDTNYEDDLSNMLYENEEILLDQNLLAENQTYFHVTNWAISPSSQRYFAYSVDTVGHERYEVFIKDLSTSEIVHAVQGLPLDGTIIWSTSGNDDAVFLFEQDDRYRTYKMITRRFLSDDSNNSSSNNEHPLMSGVYEDEDLFVEEDEAMWVGAHVSADEQYLFFYTWSTEMYEYHYIPLQQQQQQQQQQQATNVTDFSITYHQNGTTTAAIITSSNQIIDNNSHKITKDSLILIREREFGVRYDVGHYKGYFFFITNQDDAKNLRLSMVPVQPNIGNLNWTEYAVTYQGSVLFDGGPERRISSIHPSESHVLITGRENGLPAIWICTMEEQPPPQQQLQIELRQQNLMNISMNNNDIQINTTPNIVVTSFQKLEFPEASYSISLFSSPEYYNASNFTVRYTSMVTPNTYLSISLENTTQRTIIKQQNVPGYNASNYADERIYVLSSQDNSTQIPVSFVYHKDYYNKNQNNSTSLNNDTNFVHLYGYGSYGYSTEASFSSSRLQLLDRGVIYAVAHVRGGGEMGRYWYEDPTGAKYLSKKNTFTDFIDVASYFVDSGISTPEQLSVRGASAGGLLIGAALNLRPDLFKVAILNVPFVDVVCTMSDPTMNLVIEEWEEWGNPNEEKYYDYMRSYSPMNNMQENVTYPSVLVTGGLHDPRVQYWEPAKYAAELRHNIGDNSGPVILKMDMTAGHFSASDRYKYIREIAFEYAFLLDQLGLVDEEFYSVVTDEEETLPGEDQMNVMDASSSIVESVQNQGNVLGYSSSTVEPVEDQVNALDDSLSTAGSVENQVDDSSSTVESVEDQVNVLDNSLFTIQAEVEENNEETQEMIEVVAGEFADEGNFFAAFTSAAPTKMLSIAMASSFATAAYIIKAIL